jgi:hypothetical protein
MFESFADNLRMLMSNTEVERRSCLRIIYILKFLESKVFVVYEIQDIRVEGGGRIHVVGQSE